MFGGDHPNAREVFRARWQGCGNGSDKEIKFLKSSKLWLRQMGPSFDMFWPQGSCSFQQQSKHVYDSYISYKWKRLQKCRTSCACRGRWKSEAVCWLSKQIPGQVEQTAGHESWVHFCFVLCCFFSVFSAKAWTDECSHGQSVATTCCPCGEAGAALGSAWKCVG